MKVTDPTLPPRSEGARSLEGCSLFALAERSELARAIAETLFERPVPSPVQATTIVAAGGSG